MKHIYLWGAGKVCKKVLKNVKKKNVNVKKKKTKKKPSNLKTDLMGRFFVTVYYLNNPIRSRSPLSHPRSLS